MVLIGNIRTFVRVRPALPGELDTKTVNKCTGQQEDGIFKFSGNNGGSQGSMTSKYGCDDPTKNLVSLKNLGRIVEGFLSEEKNGPLALTRSLSRRPTKRMCGKRRSHWFSVL